jgi:uncharacterized protein with GYD domain
LSSSKSIAQQEQQTKATYLMLIRFTKKGAKNIKDTCKRAANFKADGRSVGLDVNAQRWCLVRNAGFTWTGSIVSYPHGRN